LTVLGDAHPDLVISDFRLGEPTTGIDAIGAIRDKKGKAIPAFLVSGDVVPERQADARAHELNLLHKPAAPLALRAMMTSLLKKSAHKSDNVSS
jgi:two-component system, sensor histidine kinase